MSPKSKITLKISEKRERLNGLLSLDELTTEQRGEVGGLTTELQNLEVEFRAAVVLEDQSQIRFSEGPEGRELRDLAGRCNVGRIFGAVLEHRSTDGRERELQEHYQLSGNQVPLALLRTEGPIEHRAVTPAPSDVGQNQAEIIPGVFPQSCAAFLGVDMPTVPVGEAVFPVLTTSASVKTPAENADADETTGAFSADVLSPSRLQASFFYSREDRSRFAMMDEALRENLSMALMDKLDQQILNGTNGLLNGTVLAHHNVTTETTFALYLSQFGYGRVDGKYAMQTQDLRIVMGTSAYAHAGETYRHQNADDLALERLVAITGGVKVSAHVPAEASNRQNSVIRLGMRRDMVAPVWSGITLIPDEFSKAKSGEIIITAVMLHAVKVLRAAGFYKQQTQHA